MKQGEAIVNLDIFDELKLSDVVNKLLQTISCAAGEREPLCTDQPLFLIPTLLPSASSSGIEAEA